MSWQEENKCFYQQKKAYNQATALFFFFFLGFCCYCVSVLSEKDLLFLTPVDNK